jgi:hypothetical protein
MDSTRIDRKPAAPFLLLPFPERMPQRYSNSRIVYLSIGLKICNSCLLFKLVFASLEASWHKKNRLKDKTGSWVDFRSLKLLYNMENRTKVKGSGQGQGVITSSA